MVMFGVVQIGMSFIPDLHNMVWVSVVAAIMSFTYSFIGLGLGIATVIGNFCFYAFAFNSRFVLFVNFKLFHD